MKDSIYLRLSVKDKKLNFSSKALKNKYLRFLESIPEGQEVDVFMSTSSSKITKAQLARIHAMCRELSNFTGNTFNEQKDLVKEAAGLVVETNGVRTYKSFADCDIEEANLAIQACIEMGDFNGIQLR